MAINSIYKVISIYICIYGFFLFVVPDKTSNIYPQTLCSMIRGHKYCVHCFNSIPPHEFNTQFTMDTRTPYAFLATIYGQQPFTCREMLQVLDEQTNELRVQITKQVNDYLNLLNTTIEIVKLKHRLSQQGKAFVLLAYDINVGVPIIQYETQEITEKQGLFVLTLFITSTSLFFMCAVEDISKMRRLVVMLTLSAAFMAEMMSLSGINPVTKSYLHSALWNSAYLLAVGLCFKHLNQYYALVTLIVAGSILGHEYLGKDETSHQIAHKLNFLLIVPFLLAFSKLLQPPYTNKPHEIIVSSAGVCLLLLGEFLNRMAYHRVYMLAVLTLINCLPTALAVNSSGFDMIKDEANTLEEVESQLGLA